MDWPTSNLAHVGVYTITLTGYLPSSPYSADSGWDNYSSGFTASYNCNLSGGTSPASTTFTLTVSGNTCGTSA